MSNTLKGALIIGQSGGPSSVINASAYGVIRTALDADCITKVYGAYHGIKGVLEDKLLDMDAEDRAELDRLPYTPSSALGSCRYKIADPDVDDTDYKRILEIFKKYEDVYKRQTSHPAQHRDHISASLNIYLCSSLVML